MITKADLVRDLRAIGIEGRHVMVHASYKMLGKVDGGPQTVVDAFVEAVGDGVLLFPCFDFTSWTENGYWDRQRSPSKMGIITEMARKDDRLRRTTHPMLSFAVYNDPDRTGKLEREYHCVFTGPDREIDYHQDSPNAHGPGSVFAKLIENDGLLLSIGAEKQTGFKADDVGFTASVHAAVEAGVDWRMMKLFRGVYVDNGVPSIREYAASVTRDPSRWQTAVTPAHLQAEKEGVIWRVKLGEAECWLSEARRFHDWSVIAHREHPELWRKEL